MRLPSRTDRAVRLPAPRRLPKGVDRLASTAIGRYRRRKGVLRKWQRQAETIHRDAETLRQLSDAELDNRLQQMQQHFRRNARDRARHVPEAFALIAEAADRTLGMRPYMVQILGALVIHHGALAEMATGEGKSLTACFPAILAAWTGEPCHIVTANDYLAARDASEMAPLYRCCHVTAGWIDAGMSPDQRRAGYANGVVYVTSKELLADFLRDRLSLGDCWQPERRRLVRLASSRRLLAGELVMRGIGTAIVDEADSVLIDEAVTPLIISRPQANAHIKQACRLATEIIGEFTPGIDYLADRRFREIRLTEAGEERLAGGAASLPSIWQGLARRREMALMALEAREFFQRDRQYVVEGDRIVIVDELTGRMMPQRTWRHGLHQMVEAKEGVPLTDPNETLVSLSFQRFFRFFGKLGGMTGTAREAAGEFWHVYGLPVHVLPTNRPGRRVTLPGRCFPDLAAKWQAICDEVVACHAAGRPVLVGTRSIAASEQLARLLDARGIACQVLNAVRHREEAAIIAGAGRRKAVTIATNMAGRGADIRLGEGVAELGGLHVIVSEPHESPRIDRQLAGRCGRQGDPGSVSRYCSLDDDLLRRFSSQPLRRFLERLHSAAPQRADAPAMAILALAQASAQHMAFRQRQAVMRADDWLSDALAFARTDLAPAPTPGRSMPSAAAAGRLSPGR